MKSIMLWLLLSAVILTAGQSAQAPSQYTAEKLLGFLQEIQNRHDENSYAYLANELDLFIASIPDTALTAHATLLLAKVHNEKGHKHEALANACKTMILYPSFRNQKECAALAQEIIAKDKKFAEKQALFTSTMTSPLNHETDGERYFRYITFLREWDNSELYDLMLKECRFFESRFTTDPQLFPVMQVLADLCGKMKKEREAALAFWKLEWMFPGHPQLAQTMYKRADLLYDKLDDYDGAVEVLQKLILNYPQDEQAGASLLLIGKIKSDKRKDYTGALEALRQLLTTYPQDKNAVEALLYIGEINDKKIKNYPTAVAAYDELVEKYRSSPRGVEALERSGDIYNEEVKNYVKAAEYYARVSELYPTYVKAPDLLIKAGSICEEKVKDMDKAVGYYQTVIDKYPEHKKAQEAKSKIAKATGKK
jgi:TolA-binding protein